jgi:NADPH:quinone reductase-like Zn-dependent oxidoreductase
MKAIVYHSYGSPDVLRYEDIDKPTAGDDQVLMKVRAASVNPHDWHTMRGTPYILRMQAGLRKPKGVRLGIDVAGQVEAVGRNVTQFKTGDEVREREPDRAHGQTEQRGPRQHVRADECREGHIGD